MPNLIIIGMKIGKTCDYFPRRRGGGGGGAFEVGKKMFQLGGEGVDFT